MAHGLLAFTCYHREREKREGGGGEQQHLSKFVTSARALTHSYLGDNVCAFPSRALTWPAGKLNTSPVNEVMLYLCGSQATEPPLYTSLYPGRRLLFTELPFLQMCGCSF